MSTSVGGSGSLSSLLNSLGTNTSTGSSSGSAGSSGTSGSGAISSAGLASGLNVTAIVTALVNAKAAPAQSQITNSTTQATNQQDGLNALKSALATLDTALATLTNPSTYKTFDATLDDTTIATTTTLTSAVPGNYKIDVTQLAAAQKRSSGVVGTTATPGPGTLTIGVGKNSVNIAISATDTIASIAAKINGATGNPGVSATIINGSSGSQMLLTSTKTGVANGFTVSASSDSSSALAGIATALSTPGSNEATDAQLTIDNVPVDSASNSVSGALDGVTLNLAKTGSTNLTVSQDTDTVSTAVQGFVTAYNSYVTEVNALQEFVPASGSTPASTGALIGDATLESIQRQISSLLSATVPGNSIGSLAGLGITRSATDGTLQVDSDTLNAAVTTNSAAVQDLFAGTNGYATKLQSTVEGYTSNDGIIGTRLTSLTATLTGLGTQQTALNARMSTYQTQLTAQYTQLDTLMASLNTTSSFLTSTLAAMTKSTS
jgi:flagellar hook-associated protein 2